MSVTPTEERSGEAVERPLSPKEKAAIIYRIKTLMHYHGITVSQLARAPVAKRPPAPPRPVKYRHPVTGETWDGSGDHPPWLRHALLKEGYRVEELRPQAQEGMQSGTTAPGPDGGMQDAADDSVVPDPAPAGKPDH